MRGEKKRGGGVASVISGFRRFWENCSVSFCDKEKNGSPAGWLAYIFGVLTAVVEDRKNLDLFTRSCQ